jgi:hypothetical protein
MSLALRRNGKNPQKATRTASAVLGLVLLSGLTLACGGGGGGGGPTAPPPPAPIVLTPAGGSATNSVSIAQGPGTAGSTLEVEIRANSVTDLYGVAFDLEYPANLLRPAGAATTGFLNQDGTQVSFVSGLERDGVMVVGFTRLGPVAGVTGSGFLARIRFTAIATGSGTLRFTRTSAFNSRGTAITDFTWSGATVQVNQVSP